MKQKNGEGIEDNNSSINDLKRLTYFMEICLAIYKNSVIEAYFFLYTEPISVSFLFLAFTIVIPFCFKYQRVAFQFMQVDESKCNLLVISAFLYFPLRMYFFVREISDEMKNFALIPFIILTNFVLFINTFTNMRLTCLCLTYIFICTVLFAPLHFYDFFIILCTSLLILARGFASISESLKVDRLLDQQTRHMSAIHHEIKTPLQGIIGAADIIQHEVQSFQAYPNFIYENVKEFHEIIRISSIHLTEVIEHMMRYSKLLNGPPNLDLCKIETSVFLQELKIIGSAYPRNTCVELVFAYSADLPEYIFADRTSLQQILTNLLSNAIKFTETGIIRISVFASSEFICFVCEDTGHGMTPQFIQEKLFKPFSQENLLAHNRPKGLGLGLALSKYLIEKMGGKFEVSSELGKGTKMSVLLPLFPRNIGTMKDSATDSSSNQTIEILLKKKPFEGPLSYPPDFPPKRNELRETSPKIPKSLTKKRVLVIDDSAINRQVLCRLLKQNDFECIEAKGGNEGIDLLLQNKNEIHIILLDMFMPVMDGAKTSLKIREITKDWDIPPLIVGCSADNSQDTQKKFLESGINHFLNKPISSNAVAALYNLLNTYSLKNIKHSSFPSVDKVSITLAPKKERSFSLPAALEQLPSLLSEKGKEKEEEIP